MLGVVEFGGVEFSAPMSWLVAPYTALFFMGMILSRVIAKSEDRYDAWSGKVLLLMSMIALASVASLEIAGQRLPTGIRTYVWGGVYCSLIYGLLRTEKVFSRIYRIGLLQLLGAASYALYLVHYPAVSVLCKITSKLCGTSVSPLLLVVLFVVFSVGICSFSILIHVCIEKPITKRAKDLLLGRAPLVS